MKLVTIISSKKIEFVPIIYEFLDKVKKHIIIFDHAKREKIYAKELKRSIEKLNQHYNVTSDIVMLEIDEDSKRDMQHIDTVVQRGSDEIYLNGAGADVALFTILSSIVLRADGKVVAYDKEDNSYNLITKNGFVNNKIEHNMSIEDFLTLMGEEILEEVDQKEIIHHKDVLNQLFLDTKRVFKVRKLLVKNRTEELKKRYPKVLDALQILGVVDDKYIMRRQGGLVEFGYLFEKFIFLQLSSFDFDDIKTGVKIRFDVTQVERSGIDVTNEFDILVIKNNRLGFIECKLGSSLDPIGTIYKSDSIMEYFGESASSLIVNIQQNRTPHLKNSKKNFGASVIFRAETKDIMVYNTFDFGRNSFRVKIREAFGVDIRDEHIKSEDSHSLRELEERWNR